MAIHFRPRRTAYAKLRRYHVRLRAATLTVASTLVLLIGLVLFICRIYIVQENPPSFIAYVSNEESVDLSDMPKVKDISSNLDPSASVAPSVSIAISPVITALEPMEVNMPATEDTRDSLMNFGAMTLSTGSIGAGLEGAYGMGARLGGGGDGNGKGGGGGKAAGGGKPISALEGTLYDFKKKRNGRPSDMADNEGNMDMVYLLGKFYRNGWRKSVMLPFWHAKEKLYCSCFYLPNSEDKEAPHAYDCDDVMEASRWAAVYRGKVKAPKSGRFRFVGIGDSVLAVRFNHKNVLAAGFHALELTEKGGRKKMRDGEEVQLDTWNGHRSEIAMKNHYVYSYPQVQYWVDLFTAPTYAALSNPCIFNEEVEEEVCAGSKVVGKHKKKIFTYEDGPIEPGRKRKVTGEREIEVVDRVCVKTKKEIVTRKRPLFHTLYQCMEDLQHKTNLEGGFEAGTPFEVKEGEWYDIEVLVAEVGGGKFGFCLLIDDMDESAKLIHTNGEPVFQLFRTAHIAPTAEEYYKEKIHFPMEGNGQDVLVDEEMIQATTVPGARSEFYPSPSTNRATTQHVAPPYDTDSMIWEARPRH